MIAGRLGAKASDPIEEYLAQGRRPWSRGYAEYKYAFLRRALADARLLAAFRDGERLPEAYGPGLDERVVEYPWVLARLRPGGGAVMDAGSTFSTPLILDLPQVQGRPLVIYTLATDWVDARGRASYVFGDLRATILKAAVFESICCISTLEHVGMAPTMEFSMSRPYPGAQPETSRQALAEFRRLLVPGGQLLLTVPFGRREDHGWMRQLDRDDLDEVAAAFGGRRVAERFYRYRAEGWYLSTAEECAEARYYNVHAQPEPDPDNAAAARAVACLDLARDEEPWPPS